MHLLQKQIARMAEKSQRSGCGGILLTSNAATVQAAQAKSQHIEKSCRTPLRINLMQWRHLSK
jgi:hypothetical protein